METDDVLLLAGLGVGAYLLWRHFGGGVFTDAEGTAALSNAGLEVTTTDTGKIRAQAGDDAFFFRPGELDKLNWAQRALIGLDRVVPGTFLTRWTLT